MIKTEFLNLRFVVGLSLVVENGVESKFNHNLNYLNHHNHLNHNNLNHHLKY